MNIIDETKKDYISLCKNKLQLIFPTYIPNEAVAPVYDIERYYFRRITSVKRKIYISKKLNDISSHLEKAFREICDNITNGRELLKFQSRFLKKSNFDDKMLADWGIQHLHLETTIESDGYVKRSNELLFIRFTEKEAYLIGIYEHGDWSDTEIMETIHVEWPESIESFKMHNIIALENNISTVERQTLRSIGVNTPIQISDGTVYMGPGMGLTTAGTPAITTMKAQGFLRYLHRGFDTIKQKIDNILPGYEGGKITIGIDTDTSPGHILFIIKETGLVISIEDDY